MSSSSFFPLAFAATTVISAAACAPPTANDPDPATSDLSEQVHEQVHAPAPVARRQAERIADRVSYRAPIHFYAQPPLAITVGQAATAKKDATDVSGFGPAQALPAKCVGGDVRSLLDDMRAQGSQGLGMTVEAHYGTDGSKPTLVSAPASADRFLVDSLVRDTLLRPAMRLDRVAAFQAAVMTTPTRVAGISEINATHNVFRFQNEHRTSTGADCGEFFARSLTAGRFLSYAFVLDFQDAKDVTAFHDAKYTASSLLEPTPALEAFLVARSVNVSVHVLASSGIATYVEKKIHDDRCDALNLSGCEPLRAHLASLLQELTSLPGEDETLDSVLAPDATWGVYGVNLSDYKIFP